ncbi:ATP-dependent DNA ligase [Candidatus Wolfebacteria bacterium]|nr:ATP-dependent DNA ligase [Candidatus Wolfebacteria bacterium]
MSNTKFLKLAEVFTYLEKTSSNLAMIDILADFFPQISSQEAKITAYLLRGNLGPSYESLDFGLALKMTVKAIAYSEKIDIKKIENLLQETGDLGLVIEEFKKNKKGKGLSIEEVFKKMIEIAKIGGEGSQEKKIIYLADLLSEVSGIEAKYIIRMILGTLRLGVGEMTFLQGLARAFGKGKEQKEILEYAFNILSDLGEVAFVVSKWGIKKIGEVEPKVGVPIRMMLANRVENLKEVSKHISGNVSVEGKYDGERIQAHIKKNGEISLFSRQHENITHQYPDIIKGLKESFKGKEAIIEGEVVAFDKNENKNLSFQILMSRRRKHKIEEYVQKIPVRYFLFDLLYLNNENYLNKSLKERKFALEKFFKKTKNITFAEYVITDNFLKTENYFNDSIKKGNEGVMVKDFSGIYQAGTRGWLWIKFKKEYEKDLADTFDLVVVGALYGSGRRAKTYGSLLVASYDPETNEYYSFTKVGTGLTDENLAKLPKILDKYKLENKHKLVKTYMNVDVWFEPKIVIEISGAEITVSPVHTVAENKIKTTGKQGGLALRFPKFLRLREKTPEDTTTVKEIYELYKGIKKRN